MNFDDFFNDFGEYTLEFFQSPFDTSHRLFLGYLLSSLLIAVALYLFQKKKGGLINFLFPRHVWSHPTALLDVRYFFFHSLIGHFLMRGLGATMTVVGLVIVTNLGLDVSIINDASVDRTAGFWVTAFAFITLFVVADFAGFLMHYMQHKIPLLWQFHKVHHAGEVIHPLSNFREHPVDNLFYKVVNGLFYGITLGFIFKILGFKPSTVTIFGVIAWSFIFNIAAYSLRHSHIWLKWPGILSVIFGSPAHHQIHHSRHPDHLDKNFAFVLPIWDVLFGTYVMDETNKKVEFGIIEDSSELNSCLNLYIVPFQHASLLLKGVPRDQVADESLRLKQEKQNVRARSKVS